MDLSDVYEDLINSKPPESEESSFKDLPDLDLLTSTWMQPDTHSVQTSTANDDRKRKYSELEYENERETDIQVVSNQTTYKKHAVQTTTNELILNHNSSTSDASSHSNLPSNFTTDSPLFDVVANQVTPQITGSLFTDLSVNPTYQDLEAGDDEDEDNQNNPNKPVTLISTSGNFTKNKTFANIYLLSPAPVPARRSLRPIVIDGSNVAWSHGKGKTFSVQGLLICMNYFLEDGHSVKAFLPQFRQQQFPPLQLKEVTERGLVIFTPSRVIGGCDGKKRIISYDDRYILQYATLYGGIVVSNDYYRDLYDESEDWNETIRQQILPFTWASENCLMFPADPLGRNSPRLEDFLRFP